jgi:hypothetical protein
LTNSGVTNYVDFKEKVESSRLFKRHLIPVFTVVGGGTIHPNPMSTAKMFHHIGLAEGYFAANFTLASTEKVELAVVSLDGIPRSGRNYLAGWTPVSTGL